MATGSQLHIDVPLSNISIAAFNENADVQIASALLPIVPVDAQSDKYYTLTADDFLRIPDTKRSPKTMARLVNFSVSSDAYRCENFALASDYPLEDLSNADRILRLQRNASRLVTSGLGRDYVQRVANLVTSISNVGSGVALTGGSKWSDYVNSDPISDVTTAHAFIKNGTNFIANTALIDYDTLAIVRRHPVILDMYKYTSGGQATVAQLQEVFGVQRLLVGNGIARRNLEGGTASTTNIWGNSFVLAYVDPNPVAPETATAGLSFRWTPTDFPAPMVAYINREQGAGSKWREIVEAQYFQTEKMVAPGLMYTITGAL